MASIVRTFRNDTLLAFTVNLLYCVSLYLHSCGNNHFYTFVKCDATIQCSTVVSQNQHTGPHWWQGENVHCRTDLTFLLYTVILTSYSIYM